jgi:hypothetical protein
MRGLKPRKHPNFNMSPYTVWRIVSNSHLVSRAKAGVEVVPLNSHVSLVSAKVEDPRHATSILRSIARGRPSRDSPHVRRCKDRLSHTATRMGLADGWYRAQADGSVKRVPACLSAKFETASAAANANAVPITDASNPVRAAEPDPAKIVWGAYAMVAMKKGAVVGDYSEHAVLRASGVCRNTDVLQDYLFDVDVLGESIVVDANTLTNPLTMLNDAKGPSSSHSSRTANCEFSVCVRVPDMRVAVFVIMTADAEAGQELLVEYGEESYWAAWRRDVPLRAKALAALLPEAARTHFKVERIVGKKRSADGRLEYKVRWQGYAAEHDTWEPAEELRKDMPAHMAELLKNML